MGNGTEINCRIIGLGMIKTGQYANNYDSELVKHYVAGYAHNFGIM